MQQVRRQPRIGVLAVQGDVREHLRSLTAAGADAIAVRRPAEVAEIDADLASLLDGTLGYAEGAKEADQHPVLSPLTSPR